MRCLFIFSVSLVQIKRTQIILCNNTWSVVLSCCPFFSTLDGVSWILLKWNSLHSYLSMIKMWLVCNNYIGLFQLISFPASQLFLPESNVCLINAQFPLCLKLNSDWNCFLFFVSQNKKSVNVHLSFLQPEKLWQ